MIAFNPHFFMISWRSIQRQNFTNWKKLFTFLELDLSLVQKIDSNPQFPLNLPIRLARKIQKKSLRDPILRQFLPLAEEKLSAPGFSEDPVQDLSFKKTTKLLHKYKGRALLVATSACAMNCRFCFRKNFDYDTQNKLFDEEITLIEKDPSLSEILLSGGDPLSLDNQALESLLTRLSNIPHVKRIRFHTRFPIGIPERIDEEFLEILARQPKQIVFMLHINHPSELDEDVLFAIKKIQKQGIPVLQQSVLLKDINDDLETQRTLLEKLIDNGIIPCYIHQLDKVEGSSHFEVDEEEGMYLVEELRNILPGYGVPKYVKEVAGDPSKRIITALTSCS